MYQFYIIYINVIFRVRFIKIKSNWQKKIIEISIDNIEVSMNTK